MCGGLRSHAAQRLGCVPTTIANYVERHPKLKEVEREALESTLDLAESKLIENIDKGKEASIFFYLKCKGKSRGYVEKDGVITLETLRRIMEQMAVVVLANVKDDATLRAVEEGWEAIEVKR